MQTLKASQAKNQFGKLLDMAQAEPVRIQKNGRDVAVVVSADDFQRLVAASGQVNPTVAKLHRKSAARWAQVYEALAK